MTNEQINPLTIAERQAIVAIFDGKTSNEQIASVLRMVALQVRRNADDFSTGDRIAKDILKTISTSINRYEEWRCCVCYTTAFKSINDTAKCVECESKDDYGRPYRSATHCE